MKFVLAVFMALFLATSFAADLSGKASGGSIFMLGTLADANNPVQMALAPEYTRLAAIRTLTANRLKDIANSKESNVDSIKSAIFMATRVQQLADEVRKELDALSTSERVDYSFSKSLDAARSKLRQAEIDYNVLLWVE